MAGKRVGEILEMQIPFDGGQDQVAGRSGQGEKDTDWNEDQ